MAVYASVVASVNGVEAILTVTWRNAPAGGGSVIYTQSKDFKLLGNTLAVQDVQNRLAQQGALINDAYTRSLVIDTYLNSLLGVWTPFP